MKEFEIKDNVLIKYLGDSVDSNNLPKKINIPDGIKIIKENSFRLANINELIIPKGVEVIENGAFSLTFNLKKITFPSTLKKIGSGAFSESTITEIEILSDNLELDGAFLDCYALEKIKLGKNVKIKKYTFDYCTSLKEITLSKPYYIEDKLSDNINLIIE